MHKPAALAAALLIVTLSAALAQTNIAPPPIEKTPAPTVANGATLDPPPAVGPGEAYPDVREYDMRQRCRGGRRGQRYYPSRAMEREQQGMALLDCAIGADGKFDSCQIIREDPEGWDFGVAALGIACHFTVEHDPGLPADSSVYRRSEGEALRARVPIRFRINN